MVRGNEVRLGVIGTLSNGIAAFAQVPFAAATPQEASSLRWYGWTLTLCWTAVVAGLLIWSVVENQRGNVDEAMIRAEMAREKDIAYRRWVQVNGGVYIPVTPTSQPNPHLNVPERDITTPSGKALTLVNSSYMVRQVSELAGDSISVKSHITSLKPLRPQNAPDPREAEALRQFEQGAQKVTWQETMDGRLYLRTMWPFVVNESCLKCHAQQGYQVGDIRGGITTSVPLPTLFSSLGKMWATIAGYGLLWTAGLTGIGFSWRRLQQHERKREHIEEQLRHAALHDALTGLPNRRIFHEDLRHAIREDRHSDRRFAVMLLDLDRFKVVNDGLGHAMGDRLLIEVARRLVECVGADHRRAEAPLVARLGGDEFAVLLRQTGGSAEAQALATAIQHRVAEPVIIAGLEIHSSASIGLVISSGAYEVPEEVLRDADTALYAAKNAGRARYALFNSQMHDMAMRRLQLDAELRKAIENDEFVPFFQPIVDLRDGPVVGFEALVRWQHPTRGLVSPLEFIPVAEETGLIVHIGWKVLESSCRQLRLLQQQFPDRELSISVNLSKRQLTEKDLVSRIAALIERTKVTPRLLKLEVTESLVMDQAEAVTPVLADLRKLGVMLAMDDFGTGHSSLSCLHRFPVDYLKIDRAFINNMELNREYAAIVHAVVTLAHNLGMTVVAEGVETQEQVLQLQTLDCDLGQGFLFSKPLPAAKLAAVLGSTHWMKKSA